MRFEIYYAGWELGGLLGSVAGGLAAQGAEDYVAGLGGHSAFRSASLYWNLRHTLS